eukprot:CAMPEP_0171324828 /NCGR_PEP_ID=MMETSP0816-20121228/116439_1 /TAXON_ID=420281 /ORGANISM="Proboscia inermis, Strain CCAP1064/1" /LENGTH=43 /DNA_ID= /DNA_START= /DNA_END= /DNA_ORIENTATION=
MAPEVIKYAKASKSSDVYGFGIVLWEIATCDIMYSGVDATQII